MELGELALREARQAGRFEGLAKLQLAAQEGGGSPPLTAASPPSALWDCYRRKVAGFEQEHGKLTDYTLRYTHLLRAACLSESFSQ